MRILSIGVPLPSPLVDNHSIANAPSIFDYDACIIDPQAVSEQIEGIVAGTEAAKTAHGQPLQSGASGSFHFGIGELLAQRRLELQALVERGGVILLFAYPNVSHPSVASFPGLDRYSLIPAALGDPFRWPQMRPGYGGDIRATMPEHPISGYIDDLSGRLTYHAVWNPTAADFPSEAQPLAASIGGAVVAIEYPVGPGRIICAPPPAAAAMAASQRKRVTASLLELVERLLDYDRDSRPPSWVSRYDTPEASAARESLKDAERELKAATRRRDEAAALVDDVTRFQSMLWRPNQREFERTVRDAFRILGYTVPDSVDAPAELRDRADVALLEVTASNEAVSDRVYLSLQQRIEEHFLRRNVRPKGVIVVSGQRQTDPRLRRDPLPKTLLNACQTFGYALIPVEALYELVNYALEEPDPDELAEMLSDIRASIAATAGLLEIQTEEDTPPNEQSDAASASDNGVVAPASGEPAPQTQTQSQT